MKRSMLGLTIAALLLPPAGAAAQTRPAQPQTQPTRPGKVRPARPAKPTRPTTKPSRPGAHRPTRPDRPQIQPVRPTKPVRPTRPDRPSIQPVRPTKPARPGYNRPHQYQFKRIRAKHYRYPRGYHYRLWAVGHILPALLFSSAYYYDDYHHVGYPPHGYRWVRYGPDLLLVNIHTHRIAYVVTGVFY
ncbi:RcnB family protein [Sphingomonas sp. URHD0057]|uniref:RcnB family protein n=1 Tax=Sphingomonas sp. URHD0057 TaxID=1380389 RepID=UPI00048CCD9F|nr:RcnB family protein [Sphingomonas sp. URHD0057]